MSQTVEELFPVFAKDGSTIPFESVAMIVRACGYCPTDAQIQDACRAAGVAGAATQAQVAQVVNSLKHAKDDNIEGTITDALKLFDHDGGDMVTVSELAHVLGSFGEKMSKEDIDEIFGQAEVDGFGQINIQEFALLMRKETGEEDTLFA